jgi:tetratricopeptide (TPR) repeat protein
MINALLVWHLLGKLRLRFAWMGGLIFALHPVQVESVAWISELKNTLSFPFFVLSMGYWIDYEERRDRLDYQWSVFWFLIAMLCKITMAPFPVVVLLYAWWKRGRISADDLKASAPFFAISLTLGLVTVWVGTVYAQGGHALPDNIPLGGLFSRIEGSGLITAVYLSRALLPVDFFLVYPQWHPHRLAWLGYLPWVVLLAGACWLWGKRRTWGRHVLFGLGFFLLFLGPFLGFRAISYMSFTWVMDHFLYIPLLGLIGLLVAALQDLQSKLSTLSHTVTKGAFFFLCALMAWESHALAGLFTSEETLWAYTLKRNPDVWLAHHDLGCNLVDQGRYAEAIPHFEQVVRLQPDLDLGYYNLGLALDKIGKTQEAWAAYQAALRRNPDNPKVYLNLGEMRRRVGDSAGAEDLFRQGVKIAPEDPSLCIDLAGILGKSGRWTEAIRLYESALPSNSDYAPLQYNLGVALLHAGRLSDAQEHLEDAVALDPKIAAAHENLGAALAQQGHLPDAIDQFEAALQLDSTLVAARSDLALALAQSGRIAEAIDQFKQVLQVDPTNARAQDSLAKLQQYELQQSATGGTKAGP